MTLLQRIKESLQLLSLFLWPSRSRSVMVYRMLGEHNNLGQKTRFLNLGYWKTAKHYDNACRDLALLLGQKSELNPEDTVLDVGCGFGEQDQLWMQAFKPRSISAINITPAQIERAKADNRFEAVNYQVASATDLPFEADHFDKILALESAFHFDSRELFFSQALKVLKPGGKMVLADVYPYHNASGWLSWLKVWWISGLWQVPLSNHYNLSHCKAKLVALGFEQIEIEDISEYVWMPFKNFAAQRVKDQDIQARVHPWIRFVWSLPNQAENTYAYVILSATKPLI
jgi:SAM-dependent methyltransferase